MFVIILDVSVSQISFNFVHIFKFNFVIFQSKCLDYIYERVIVIVVMCIILKLRSQVIYEINVSNCGLTTSQI